jgi:hypothetical protein
MVPTSTSLIELPADFLAQVFGVAKAVLTGGTWVLIVISVGLFLAVFFAGKAITWIKKGLSRGRRR